MGIFDFLKRKKDVLNNNDTNYNNNLNEEVERKQKKENNLIEFKKNICKLIEIDDAISEVADGDLIIQMNNNTLCEFSVEVYNFILDYFEDGFVKIYLFHKRNYLIDNFFYMDNKEVNLNLIYTQHLNKRKIDVENQISEISNKTSKSRYTYSYKASYYISNYVCDKLKIVNENKSLVTNLSLDLFNSISEPHNITNQNCRLIGLKTNGYYSIYEAIKSMRNELNDNYLIADLWNGSNKFDVNLDDQREKILNKIYEHILSICDVYQSNQDEIEYNLENIIKSLKLKKLSAIDLFERGSYKMKYQDYGGAIVDFTKAIEIDNYYTSAYFNRGNAYMNSQEFMEAICDMNKVIESEPNNSKAFENRGICLYEFEQFDSALNDLNKSMELDPKSNAHITIDKIKKEQLMK